MSDLISRQNVIGLIRINRESEYKKSCSAECEHKSVIRSKHDAHVAFCDYLVEQIKDMPSAEPVITCDGCRFVSTYDTDFPCCSCVRREKDYYAPER